ncbi:MAG: nitroreductase/quinone reductase family protein [Pseudomonadales bacterium]
MKALKVLLALGLIYVGVVVLFESLLGYFQPDGDYTMVITTTDADGNRNDRVLAKVESDGSLYAAANHWPRAWYRQALANPAVSVNIDGESADYAAVPVEGAEHDRVNNARPLGIGFQILTGFPPRYFLRLEPR